MQERVERSAAGQVVLTALMAVLAAAVLVWNLPASGVKDALKPRAGNVLLPVGLDQDWALFAPDPRSFSVGLYARVTYADGREVVRRPPGGGVLLGPYRDYRWQKYVERVRADDYAGLWEPTARWIARTSDGEVRRVVLVRTFRDAVVPGSGLARPERGEYAFYTLELP